MKLKSLTAGQLLQKRFFQNWIWIAVLVVAAAVLVRPQWAFGASGGELADELVDLFGMLLIGVGVAIRVCARGWKYEVCDRRRLVTTGIYGYVRHPLYAGSFLIGIGLCTVVGSLAFLAVFIACFWAGHAYVIRSEEEHLAQRWPQEHAAYRRDVPALVPTLGSLLRPRRVVPRYLFVAVAKEADCVCIWPMRGLAFEIWEDLALGGGLEHHTVPVALLTATILLLGLAWLYLRSRLRSLSGMADNLV